MGGNKSLTTLGLGGNRLGAPTAKALAKALRTNSALKKLYLTRCAIRDEGAEALAGALWLNSTLTALYVNECQITDAGAKALEAALRSNSALGTLCMIGNPQTTIQ